MEEKIKTLEDGMEPLEGQRRDRLLQVNGLDSLLLRCQDPSPTRVFSGSE